MSHTRVSPTLLEMKSGLFKIHLLLALLPLTSGNPQLKEIQQLLSTDSRRAPRSDGEFVPGTLDLWNSQ